MVSVEVVECPQSPVVTGVFPEKLHRSLIVSVPMNNSNYRNDRIRTCDPMLPRQVLYQTELHSGAGFHSLTVFYGLQFTRPTDFVPVKELPCVMAKHASTTTTDSRLRINPSSICQIILHFSEQRRWPSHSSFRRAGTNHLFRK